MIARAVFVLLLHAIAGCAGDRVPVRAPAHGNLFAEATSEHERARLGARAAALPLVVLVERKRVVAIDPVHARTRWTRNLEVTGHPVAGARTVVLPVGQRLFGLDRKTGATRFEVELPGEAIVGLALSEPWVAATVLDPDGNTPGQILGISTEDGHVRWHKRSTAPLGIPDVVGEIAVLAVGDQVISLRLDSGREVARIDLPPALRGGSVPPRVVRRGELWFVGDGSRWVPLDVTGANAVARELYRTYAPAFATSDGIDAGHGDDERLRMWLRMSRVDATPRDAILLARRAVIAIRLDGDGRPVRARWVHLEREGELVAMEVSGDRVVLVREDGEVVELADDDGRELVRISGGAPVRGALILAGASSTFGNTRRSDDPDSVADLRRLLAIDDPRLLPAQELAADLLWRSDEPGVRHTIRALAAAPEPEGERARVLRSHAAGLLATRWGSGSRADVDAIVAALTKRPVFAADATTDFAEAIAAVVRTGRLDAVLELSALLLHPGTSDADVMAILAAVRALEEPAALPAIERFFRRYHADEVVLAESDAVAEAARILLGYAHGSDELAARTRAVLREVADDPVCDVQLRSLIMHGLLEPGPLASP